MSQESLIRDLYSRVQKLGEFAAINRTKDEARDSRLKELQEEIVDQRKMLLAYKDEIHALNTKISKLIERDRQFERQQDNASRGTDVHVDASHGNITSHGGSAVGGHGNTLSSADRAAQALRRQKEARKTVWLAVAVVISGMAVIAVLSILYVNHQEEQQRQEVLAREDARRPPGS